MAIGDDYINADELASWLNFSPTDAETTLLWGAITATTTGIEGHCNRHFNMSTSPESRVFYPMNERIVITDDIAVTTGLTVKISYDNTENYTETATDYELHPLNGVQSGVPGFPYTEIRRVNASFPLLQRRAPIQVTARWGWAAVPTAIKQAALILAAETFKMREAGPGGTIGFGEFGPVRVRDNRVASAILARYVRQPVMVG